MNERSRKPSYKTSPQAAYETYYAAVLARDYRFDGKFFTGVKTTGIYCRPICPARPKRENVEFFDSALLAEKAGYRPCLRCRPEAAPLSPAWYGKSALVQRALRRIIDVGLREESEDRFAAHFGVTARHLRRLFHEEIGKTPHQFDQEQRLNLAREMIVETSVPITEIAFASGFQSLRRFNDAFKARFFKAPRMLRKTKSSKPEKCEAPKLYLSYRPPLNWTSLLTFLKRHEISGVEEISDRDYVRYVKTQTGMVRVAVENVEARSALAVSFDRFDADSLYACVRKLRRLFDLDSDPLLISTSFETSSILHKLDRKNPGVRSVGAWSPFESAIVVILNQLVSNQQARQLTRQLVERYGEENWHGDKKIFSFPSAQRLATADLSALWTTQKRKATIREFSRQVASGEIDLSPHRNLQKTKEALLKIPGVGPWTVESIAMRCLSDPDSFPHSDLILKRVQMAEPKLNLNEVSPWRSYAVYLLWDAYATKLSKAKRSQK